MTRGQTTALNATAHLFRQMGRGVFRSSLPHVRSTIRRERSEFVAPSSEVDVASRGNTIETARDNLREALVLFFECASHAEIQDRLGDEVFNTQVAVGCG